MPIACVRPDRHLFRQRPFMTRMATVPADTAQSYRTHSGILACCLLLTLMQGCTGAQPIPVEARLKITTWIDASGVYYGSYWGRLHLEHRGHPNFRPTPTFEQAISTVNPWEEWRPTPELREDP